MIEKLFLAVALIAAIGYAAWKLHDSGWDQGRAALVAEQNEAQAARQRVADAAAKLAAAKKQDTAAKDAALTGEVTRHAAKTVARNRCFSDAGLVLYNALGEGVPVPSGRPAAVPGEAASGDRSD